MNEPPYEPTDSDLEQVVDEARKDLGLGPAPRTPAQGIKDMTARIHELNALKQKIIARIETANTARQQAPLYETLADINKQLAEARARKREYETLLKAGN